MGATPQNIKTALSGIPHLIELNEILQEDIPKAMLAFETAAMDTEKAWFQLTDPDIAATRVNRKSMSAINCSSHDMIMFMDLQSNIVQRRLGLGH